MKIPTQISAVVHFLGAGAALGLFLVLSWPGGTGLMGVKNDAWTAHEQLFVAGAVGVLGLSVAQFVMASQGPTAMRLPIMLIAGVDLVAMFTIGDGFVLVVFLMLQALAFACTLNPIRSAAR